MSGDRCKSAYQGKCAACRARRYDALQDQRAKLVRWYQDLELEIADIDRQLEDLER